jgi:hypothetical protein
VAWNATNPPDRILNDGKLHLVLAEAAFFQRAMRRGARSSFDMSE